MQRQALFLFNKKVSIFDSFSNGIFSPLSVISLQSAVLINRYKVLRIDRSSGVGDPGNVLWDLCLCNLLSWFVVFVCMVKGIKSSGKVCCCLLLKKYIQFSMSIQMSSSSSSSWPILSCAEMSTAAPTILQEGFFRSLFSCLNRRRPPVVVQVTFLTPTHIFQKVTPALALWLIKNLQSDSCSRSKNLKPRNKIIGYVLIT